MKNYPDNTLRQALTKRGIPVKILWQENMSFGWLEGLNVNGCVVIVQTFHQGGWEAYSHCATNNTDATIQDVIDRTA